MPNENETVHTVKVEGTEEAIRKFEALAEAKARAAGSVGLSSGGSMVAERGGGGYWGFSDAPAAPGTSGNPVANASAVTAPGAVPTPGAVNGGINAGSITIHTPNVVIYAQNVSGGALGGLTTMGSAVHDPGNPYAIPPGGGAPAAPGTAPAGGGGLVDRVRGFFNSPLNPNAPYSASIRDLLTAGAETGSIAGLGATLMGALPMAAGVGLALNTGVQVAGAMYSGSMPSFQHETHIEAARAGGQYISPIRRLMMERAAAFEGDTALQRGLQGIAHRIPIIGDINNLVYEYNIGRERDRQLAVYRASMENVERAMFASALTGRAENTADFDENFLGGARYSLIQGGAMFGAGGARAAASMSLFGFTSSNGGNVDSALRYGQALIGFAGRAQYGYLEPMVNGQLDLSGRINPFRPGMPVAAQLESQYLQAAAESGDFGALSVALGNTNRNLVPYYQVATRVARGNVDNQIAGSGLSYTQSNTALIGALGGSMEQRADSMDAGDIYFARMQGVTEEQLALSRDPLRIAQLTAQKAQIIAQRASNKTAAISLRYQGEQSFLQSDIGSASMDVQIAMFGDDPRAVEAGYRSIGGYQGGLAALYTRMSQEARFSPEQRAQYENMARQATFESTTGMLRQVGGFRLGLAQGALGITSAEVGAGINAANLYGGINAIASSQFAQVGVIQSQEGLVRGQLAGEYGPITMQERLELQAKLTQLMQAEVSAREGAVRGLGQMQVALAQTAQGMASNQMQRAFITGSGGVEGFGFASRVSGAAGEVARKADAYVALLRSRGVAEDNPQMQQALLQAENAQTAFEQSEVSATQVPFSLGIRREESQTRFAISALSAFPGQYGSIRNLLGKQMQGQEHMAHEIEARRDAHRAQYGGKLPDHLEFQYEQQLQQVAMEQAGTFQQLSYGWESRLTNQMMGTPGSMAFLSPSMSFAAAIGSGVVNPHMGGTEAQVPMFLRQAQLISSLAGTTGTTAGFGVTGMTGAGALQGMEITLRVPLPGGGMERVPATVTLHGNSQDTSPAATLEVMGRAGANVPHQ